MDWAKLAADTPIAAAIIAVVVLFLQAMGKRDALFTSALDRITESFDKALDKTSKADIEAQKEIAARYDEGRERTIVALDSNTRAFGEIKGILLAKKDHK